MSRRKKRSKRSQVVGRQQQTTEQYQVKKIFYIPGDVQKVSPDSIADLLMDYIDTEHVKYTAMSLEPGPPLWEWATYNFGKIIVSEPGEGYKNYKITLMLFSDDIVPAGKSLDGFVEYAINELKSE